MDKDKITEYVLRHSKTRDEELKYDFMPALLEIIERPAHKAGKVIIIGVFSLLIAFVIWACASKVDVVITSSGSIQPVGNVNVVEAYSSGIISAINISEGQHVSKGDVLIELESKNIEIDVQNLKNQLSIYEAENKVYHQLKNGKKYTDIDVSEYSRDIRPFIQAILDNDAGYINNLSALENEKANAELNEKIAQIQLEEYNENGSYRQAQSQQLVVQQAAITREKTDIQIKNVKLQYSAKLNTEISNCERNIEDIKGSVEKSNLSLGQQKITSPVSGIINSLSVNTVGETVTAAEKLITIVPDNTPVEMVCYVKNMDIADIDTQMEAAVKLEAYPYNKYGTVNARVTYISPSSFSSEQLGSVYLVKCDLENENERIKLFPGLAGVVEIKTGKRSVMDYFLEPVMKGFGESLKEK